MTENEKAAHDVQSQTAQQLTNKLDARIIPTVALPINEIVDAECVICGDPLADSFSLSEDGRCDMCIAYRPAPPGAIHLSAPEFERSGAVNWLHRRTGPIRINAKEVRHAKAA